MENLKNVQLDKAISKWAEQPIALKRRLSIAYVACLMCPDALPKMERAINDAIAVALPRFQAIANACLPTSVSNPSDTAADVVENWILRLSETDLVDRYDPQRSAPSAYFGKIMRNVVMETIRPLLRQKTNAEHIGSVIDLKPGVLDKLAEAEVMQVVREKYLTLPPAQKKALEWILPFLDDDTDAAGGVLKAPDDRPKNPRPSYSSLSLGRKAVIEHVRPMIE